MDLYFSPLACSLATRIALYEANASANFIQVDTQSKQIVDDKADDRDFFAVNALGQVPVLREDDGWTLTENSAVLQWVADRFPQAQLAPPAGTRERARLQQWLGFIGTELHKAVFVPLLATDTAEAVKHYALSKVELRFGRLERHLSTHAYLLDAFSVADAYLVTVLNWAPYAGIDLARWPAVADYAKRMRARPAVARAIAEELEILKREREQKK
ncbi:glutathione binding-like protein [Paraburkholderia sp. J94]|uniref:glutathione binding-like protein n=1 Tax=Paraburkholderia sp. J94 TaxID=2805441 RepID=UPI002AB1B251|nr:glutathione binding-like protein [Paraburkholderia sp. J94]